MRLVLLAVLVFGLAAAPSGAAVVPCPDGDAPYSTDLAQARAGLLCLVNDERAARGLMPLTASPELDLAAQRHVEDMTARGYFGHDAPVPAPFGVTPLDRAAAAGYPGNVTETLFQVEETGDEPENAAPRAAVMSWMQSPPHCASLLSPQIQQVGAGAVRDGEDGDLTYTWALELGVVGGPLTDGGPCPAAALASPPSLRGVAVSGAVAATHRATRFALRCLRPSGTCRGRATVTARGRTIGRATVAIAAGRTETLRVRLRRTSSRRATLRLDVDRQRTALSVRL